jgi:hypothetical protein
VIAVFTKYDQFRRNIEIELEDQDRDQETQLDIEVESVFNQHYLGGLTGPPPFIRLESKVFQQPTNMYCTNFTSQGMHEPGQLCSGLIEITASALTGDVVALMLLAVQRDNLELSINQAISR